MSQFWNTRKVFLIGAAADMAATTTIQYEFGERVWAKRIVFVLTTVKDGTKAVITVGKRPTSGAAGTVLGTFEIAASQAIDVPVYVDLPLPNGTPHTLVDGSIGYDALPDWTVFDAGDEIYLTSDGGGATGTGTFWLEGQAIGDQPIARTTAWTRMPFTAA